MKNSLIIQSNDPVGILDGDGYCDIGTLAGDDGHPTLSCSFQAAEEWGMAKEIRPFSTFEEAAKAVKRGEIQACLVPGAYPNIGLFIYDRDLQVRETFVATIAPMVLVGTERPAPASVRTIFLHPATAPLLNEVNITFENSSTVVSNCRACTALMASPLPAAAITTGLCARYFELPIYRVLRVGIRMPFVVFTRAI